MKGFQKGDPRAVAAGQKGGSSRPKGRTKGPEWMAGYQAGWRAKQRADRQERTARDGR